MSRTRTKVLAVLAGVNGAGKATTVKNTGAGPALSLQTASSKSAPFATNAKGMVTNLNAQFLAGRSIATVQAGATKLNGLTAAQIADGATKLNGLTAAQIKDGATRLDGLTAAEIKDGATRLGGLTAAQIEAAATRLNGLTSAEIIAPAERPTLTFDRTAAPVAGFSTVSGSWPPSVKSGTGGSGAYDLEGTVEFLCPAPGGSRVDFDVILGTFDGGEVNVVAESILPTTSCGTPVTLTRGTASLTGTTVIVVTAVGRNTLGDISYATPLTIALKGFPASRAL